MNWTKHRGDIGMLKSLIFILHNRKASGKLSEIKLVTSLLLSSRNVGNLKLFLFHVHSEPQRKITQNQKLALSNSPRTQNLEENSSKKWKENALEALAHLRKKTLYRRQLRTKSCSTEYVGILIQASSTCSQKRHSTDDFELHYSFKYSPWMGSWFSDKLRLNL